MPTVYNSRKIFTISFFLILLLGLGLRIYKLGERSLWFDEATFVNFKPESLLKSLQYLWACILSGRASIDSAIVYNVFALFWSEIAKNEFMLRIPSVIFGIFSIFVVYRLGKSLFSREAGLISAFMLAISPFHIYYSQEFRMFSLISFLTLLSVYFLRKFMETGKTSNISGYIISHLLNIYVNILTSVYLFAEIIFFLMYRRKYSALLKKWLIAHAIISFFLIPAALSAFIRLKYLNRMIQISNPNIFDEYVSIKPSMDSIMVPIFTLKNFFAGYNATFMFWLCTFIILLTLILWGIIKSRRREETYLCLICSLAPFFILYLFRRFIYADRYLIPSSIFLYLIAVNGLLHIKKAYQIIIVMLLLVLFSFSLNNYYHDVLPITPEVQRVGVHARKDFRGAVRYIAQNAQDGDIVFHTCHNTLMPFKYYFRKDEALNTKIPEEKRWVVLRFSKDNKYGVDLLPYDFMESEFGFTDKSSVFSLEGHQRVWLAFSSWDFEDAIKAYSRERRMVEWMDRHYKRILSKNLSGIILYLYEKA